MIIIEFLISLGITIFMSSIVVSFVAQYSLQLKNVSIAMNDNAKSSIMRYCATTPHHLLSCTPHAVIWQKKDGYEGFLYDSTTDSIYWVQKGNRTQSTLIAQNVGAMTFTLTINEPWLCVCIEKNGSLDTFYAPVKTGRH